MRSGSRTVPNIDRALALSLLLSVALTAATLSTVSAQSSLAPSSTAQECRGVTSRGTGFVEQCGDRLHAWSLTLSEFKREMESDPHGRFWFNCPIELMCQNEPTIAGRFVNWAEWQDSTKDERAIYERASALSYPMRPLPPMPPPACAPFDISIAGMAGRAVCFDESGVKGGSVVVVAADDRVAFLLNFFQQGESANMLKGKVLELLPRFKIERATGDAALLKWFR